MRVLLAVVVLLGGAVPVDALAVPAGAPPGPLLAVTLVTGDRVMVRPGAGIATIRPARGREGMQFIRRREGGDTYVVPVDAATMVAAGTVDRRLFNVTKLVEHGYDDRSRADVPLIVTYVGPNTARTRRLASVNGDVVRVAKAGASGFWRSTTATGSRSLAAGVAKLWLDGRVRATLDRSVPQVGAPAAWQAGHRGQGSTVAVLDTGIDVTHPDFAGAVIAAEDFTGSESGTADRFGHGTHVAGIITGSGAAFHGTYLGVAPDARLLNGKVLDDTGFGSDSGIIAGMEWAVARGADVVNMSIGSEFPSDGTGPMDLAVNRLTAESGTLFVVSAGNTGPGGGSINSPGAADAALTVGAVDHGDALADFSSRGPRIANHAVKPDITAPGVAIAAALARDSQLARDAVVVDGAYVRLSGTSMAAPHVAGAAAILAAQHPSWGAAELKAALMGSAAARAGQTVYEQGAGRLDVARAVTQPVYATPSTVSNGMTRWPHDDDQPFRDTLTYHNAGAVPLTLTVAADVRDPAGAPAPAGMFTVDPGRVTVPPGGTASVTLVTTTAVPGPDGAYGGLVTATSGQTVVRTPVGVIREAESYDVAVTALDRAGRPATEFAVQFISVARPEGFFGSDPSGRVTIRVPKGRHYVEAFVVTPDGSLAMLVEPEVAVTGGTVLVVDARRARPVGFRVDRPEARSIQGEVAFRRVTDWGEVGFEAAGPLDTMFVAPSATAVRPDRFTYRTTAHYARPDGHGGFAASPYLYHLNREVPARVPTELVHRLRDRDLHAVHSEIAASAPEQVVSKDFLVEMAAPARFVELYSPGRAFLSSVFVLDDPAAFSIDVELVGEPAVFTRPGQSTKRWNVGVFGPNLPDNPFFDAAVGRHRNTILVGLPNHSDRTPNHFGVIREDSVTTLLRRNGQVIGEVPSRAAAFDIPSEPGTYQLAFSMTQSRTTLSTSVSATWTFRSAEVTGDELAPLPLMAVRFAPELDGHNRAGAGRVFPLPVSVQRQVGAAYGALRTLTVQVSYDDGRTWQSVPVLGHGLARTALVHHPKDADFVSLRASAVDSRGNSVEQTTIRAYALRG